VVLKTRRAIAGFPFVYPLIDGNRITGRQNSTFFRHTSKD